VSADSNGFGSAFSSDVGNGWGMGRKEDDDDSVLPFPLNINEDGDMCTGATSAGQWSCLLASSVHPLPFPIPTEGV
jgi:hypothetical protein